MADFGEEGGSLSAFGWRTTWPSGALEHCGRVSGLTDFKEQHIYMEMSLWFELEILP